MSEFTEFKSFVTEVYNKVSDHFSLQKYVKAYFAQMGSTVDFLTNEIKDKDGKLIAYLGEYKLNGNEMTVKVQMIQEIKYIVTDIKVEPKS